MTDRYMFGELYFTAIILGGAACDVAHNGDGAMFFVTGLISTIAMVVLNSIAGE